MLDKSFGDLVHLNIKKGVIMCTLLLNNTKIAPDS